jgi:hypothetical protein
MADAFPKNVVEQDLGVGYGEQGPTADVRAWSQEALKLASQ